MCEVSIILTRTHVLKLYQLVSNNGRGPRVPRKTLIQALQHKSDGSGTLHVTHEGCLNHATSHVTVFCNSTASGRGTTITLLTHKDTTVFCDELLLLDTFGSGVELIDVVGKVVLHEPVSGRPFLASVEDGFVRGFYRIPNNRFSRGPPKHRKFECVSTEDGCQFVYGQLETPMWTRTDGYAMYDAVDASQGRLCALVRPQVAGQMGRVGHDVLVVDVE